MKIGEALMTAGLISKDDLDIALSEQEKTHDRLGDICLKMGMVTPERMAPVLAQYFNIPFVRLKDFYKDIKPEAIDALPLELARRFAVIPIEINDKTLTVAMFDPLDLLAIDTLRLRTGYRIECVVASENDIREAIEYCYHNLPRMKEYIEDFIDLEGRAGESREEITTEAYAAGDQPVVQYVQSLIIQAVSGRASDILLQPKQNAAELRYRIDGMLHDIHPPPKAMIAAINTRIKILAGLDIAERRLPQDGRFKAKIGNSEIDIRVSAFPTIYGESVVMRLLSTSAPLLGLEQLGFLPEDLQKFRKLLQHPYGLVLVTGPTGSGKTTTLYTALNEFKNSKKNIVTLEDPVEYRLGFIQQSQVNPAIGFDFARGLRSILRQDPDIIMIGEIRDQETAEIAIHAALTGHLVFATLHTNDAAGAAVRLIKMGVEPFLLTSCLLGVIAQRLIRMVCLHCRESQKLDKTILGRLPFEVKAGEYFRGRGCKKCFQSGYLGRQGIYELLTPNEQVRKLILENVSGDEIRSAGRKAGMRTLREIAVEKMVAGETTLEEILRVTQETEEM
jgi:type II secretory ATPase GspE/PulE/Tfp pilus assembly ATPase PilB-like protein